MTETQTGLQRLEAKYGRPEPRQAAHKAFAVPRSDTEAAKARKVFKRVSKAPVENTETGQLYADMAEIQNDLADLADKYGKLNVNFRNTLGSRRIYGLSDVVSLGVNKALRRKEKVREIRREAASRKGNSIENLVNLIAEVIVAQHQNAIKGKSLAETIQTENLAHMRYLDGQLIERLRGGYVGGADMAEAQKEVDRLEAELKDVDSVLGDYEAKVQKAKAGGDIEAVKKLTDEMSEVLTMKYNILDGKLSADGVVSEIRRSILDSAEGVQSAKGATAAAKVNYQAIAGLIDAMSELEIKYKYAESDMIPVFKIQGKIASAGKQALDMKNALMKTAEMSQRLMETNSRLVMILTRNTFEMLQTPLYNIEKAEQTEQELRSYLKELNENKLEWAETVNRVKEVSEGPHYVHRE